MFPWLSAWSVQGEEATATSILHFGLAGSEKIWDMLSLWWRKTDLQQSRCYSQKISWERLWCAPSTEVTTQIPFQSTANLSSRNRVCTGLKEWQIYKKKKKKVTGKIGCVSSRKEETVEQFLHQQIPEKFFKLWKQRHC